MTKERLIELAAEFSVHSRDAEMTEVLRHIADGSAQNLPNDKSNAFGVGFICGESAAFSFIYKELERLEHEEDRK